jgi:hypothetical protein
LVFQVFFRLSQGRHFRFGFSGCHFRFGFGFGFFFSGSFQWVFKNMKF